MYIKYVRIHGFKSYREKTICGPLSPMHNSIVGFNGSGKSNFFAALRFVLSEQHSILRPEDRSKLLNEGAGASVLSAYVEIVFDNSDKRIDSEKEEVTIKRMIGLKKDEYFVDGKHVTRQEIANMLETAGFSKSNPYYIVEQGKVTTITEMKDNQRLALIKDVAGTNVYEEKKGESEKILNDSLRKMEEIKNNLNMIEARLEKLDKEKEELSQYYALDKERRSLHHALLSKRIQVLREKLTELERRKQELRIDSGKDSHSYEDLEAGKEALQRSVDEVRKRLDAMEEEKQVLIQEETQHIQTESEQKELVHRMLTGIEANKREIEAKRKIIAENEKSVAELEAYLEQIVPQIQKKKDRQEETVKEFHAVDREKETLQAMQRKSDYANQAERDKQLNTEILQLEKDKTTLQKDMEKARQDIEATANKKLADEAKVAVLEKKVNAFDQDKVELEAKKVDIYQKEVELQKQIRELQRSHHHCENQRQQLKKDVEDLDNKLDNGMPNGFARALRFLDDFCKRESIKGYHGPLINLIQCNERYYTAVEQTGGKQMFSAVVDDENIASRLIKAMQAAKPGQAGRISFMPLSKLRPPRVNFPGGLMDAEPLSKCIKCDDKFRVAVEQVFGSTLLCSSLEVATQYRRDHDLECVTMDGDKVQRKGAIKGGYHDHTTSKLKLNHLKQEKRKVSIKLDKDEDEARKSLQQMQQQEQQLMTEKRHLENSQGKSDREKVARTKELQDLQRSARWDAQEIAAKEKTIEANLIAERELQHKINTLHDQLAQPFSTTITEAQRERLSDLTQKHTELTRLQKKEEVERSKMEQDKSSKSMELQRVLAENQELQASIGELQGNALEFSLSLEQRKLEELEAQGKACAENGKAKEKEIVDARKNLQREEDELKQIKTKLKTYSNEANKVKNLLSSIATDREKCQKDIEIANRQLMELGSLPEAFERYKGKTEKYLNEALGKVTERLGQFKNVNKKAMDQFNQFTDQKEKFQERMRELGQGEDSIRKLIQNLDAKKDNALQTTFKMVAKHFSDVFKTIVPGGEGRLIMKTKDVQEGENEDGAGSSRRSTREYTGIGVEVRFAAGTNVQKMRELSGGQKCVVALTIIFAIQRCDPAPFYLFDEVDANLDPMYRGAVANMITQQKQEKEGDPNSGCQFLTSSFHEELVKAADHHWLVSHSGMSRMNRGTVDDQLKIVRKNALTAPQGAGAGGAA